MVNDKLQPKRTALPVSVLFTLVGALGLAAGAGQAKQLLSTTRPSTNKVKPQTPSVPAMPINNEVPVRAQSVRTTTVRILSTAAGRRDPFKPWEPPGSGGHTAGGTSGALPQGRRGLVISQLRVTGIVRQESTNNMIAVVTNLTKRAYFLRENDTVYNGVVSKITPDAVYFKENSLDSNGRVGAHEVVKRLGLAPGEGR
jgi:ribosomal protein S30